MVKSKDLKILRKKLTKADRVVDPLQESNIPTTLMEPFQPPPEGASPEQPSLSLEYSLGVDVSDSLLNDMVGLFETNMGDMYRNSSFGLDLTEKADDFRHRKARHLLVFSPTEDGSKELAAFVHFRFDYDDDEYPSRVVLYVFEIQIEAAFRRRGMGRKLMKMMEYIAQAAGLDTVMLTVFMSNDDAMQFYTKSLMYVIDESSPSKFGERADYEILSRQLTTS